MENLLSPATRALLEKSMLDELYASNKYKHVAAQMQAVGFFGAQKYFEQEAAEETSHYYKLRDFVNDMGDVISVPDVLGQTESIATIADALASAYETEVSFLNKYTDRAKQSMAAGDVAAFGLFSSFVDIQVKAVGEYGDLMKRLSQNPADVFEFDEYMGEK